ncbi:MAG: flagellar motor protein MotB [Syntrophales bacterium]
MNGQGRRHPEPDDSGGRATWMLTFSDLMMLLLVFFVLLLAFSTLQPEKASRAAASTVSALGAERMGGNALEWFIRPYTDRDIEEQKARKSAGRPGHIIRDRQAAVAAVLASVPGARIAAAAGGFVVHLPDSGLFQGESLRPDPALKAVLLQLTAIARGGGAGITVTAHGEPQDRGEALKGNRERSILRADAVARHLNETGGIPTERISIAWTGTPGAGTDRRPDPNAGEVRLAIAFPG